jgi:plasmid replication initiation protein
MAKSFKGIKPKKNLRPIRLIKKSNDLIEARHSLTTWEMRIFLKIIFLVNEEAHKGVSNFVIPIRDLIKDFKLENSRQSYQHFRDARKSLANRSIQLYQQNLETESWEMVNKSLFMETAHSVKMGDDGTITDDDDGYIRLQLHEHIKPFLLNINGSLDGNYTLFDRDYAIELPIKMLRFYLLLKRFADTGYREMTVEELRDVFDLQDKYKSFGNIKQRIIDKAQVELAEKTDIRFEYQEVKKAGSKTIVAVKFRIYSNKPHDKKTLQISERVGEPGLEKAVNTEGFDEYFDKYFLLMRPFGISATTLTGWFSQYSIEHVEQCWKQFLIKANSGKLRETEKDKQGGYLRTLIEKADFSELQKTVEVKTQIKKQETAQQQQNKADEELKKQKEKSQFERERKIIDAILKEYPTLEQEMLNDINRHDQTAYTKENVMTFPFLAAKLTFRIKQMFKERFY